MPQDNLDLDFLLQQKQKLAGEDPCSDSLEAEGTRVLRQPEPMPDDNLILSDSDDSSLGTSVIEVDDDLGELAALCSKRFEPDSEFSLDDELNINEEPLILPVEVEPRSVADEASAGQPADEQSFLQAELSQEQDVHLVLDSETEDEIRLLVEDSDDELDTVLLSDDELQAETQSPEPIAPEPPADPGESGAVTVAESTTDMDQGGPPPEASAESEPAPPAEEQSEDAWTFEMAAGDPPPLRSEQNLQAEAEVKGPPADHPTTKIHSNSQTAAGVSGQRPHVVPEPATTVRDRSPFSFASLFENSRLLGIDLGSSAIKYVELEKGARGLTLANCGHFALPEAAGDANQDAGADPVAAVVAERLTLKQFKDDLVTSAISGMEVIFKNIKVPKMARKELQQAVPWACRKELPFPLEKTAFEFRALTGAKDEDGKVAVYVIAAQKELIRQHLQKLGAARITPAKIATIPSALLQLFRACAGRDTDGCHCVVDIGAQSSHIVFINTGELQFAREISTAGQDFTRALTGTIFVDGNEIKLSEAQAERVKRDHGIPDEMTQFDIVDGVPLIEVSAMVGEVLERLTNDIHRTMDFYKERFKAEPVRKVYLTGGGALMPNLPARLSQELQVEVDVLNPFDTISLRKFDHTAELRKSGTRFAVAVGLALDKQKSLNLLPQELKRSHSTRYAKKIFRYVFVIAMLAMIFLSQDVVRQVKRVRNELQRVMAEYQQNAPNRQRFEKLRQDLQYLEQLKKRQGPVHLVDFSAVRYLKLVSQLFPANMTLTSFRYSHQPGKSEGEPHAATVAILILDGVAFANRSMEGMNLAKFLLSLKQSAEFQQVALTSQTVREDGGLQFTVECEVAP